MVIFLGLLLSIVATLFWIWMLIVAATGEHDTANKIVWVIIIVFTHFIGALIYYFVRYTPRRRLV